MYQDYLEYSEVKPGMRLINAEDVGYSMHFEYMFITAVDENSIKYDCITIQSNFVSIRKAEEFRRRWIDKAWRDENIAKAGYDWEKKKQIEQTYSIERYKAKPLDDHYMHLAFHHLFKPDARYRVGDQGL